MKTRRLWFGGAVLALASMTGCQTWFGGLTLPSGRYLEGHYPQYFSPDPAFPLPRELASQGRPRGRGPARDRRGWRGQPRSRRTRGTGRHARRRTRVTRSG